MEDDAEMRCGLGRFRPYFLQRFANGKTFMFVYGLLGTIQAMSFVYFVSTLTTLEKRFQIPSQITGILMGGNEVSQILLSMILSYRGGKGNRPLWMAWGVLFSSMSCFILAVPHCIYGPGHNALALTQEHLDYDLINSTVQQEESGSNPFLCSANRTSDDSVESRRLESSILPLLLIFFSQFVLGIGTTLYVTLGQPYLDDSIKKKNTPMLLGFTMALRTAGPAVGFVLGYLCLNIYIDPNLTPVIDRKDPRWMGAWWLGWIILGSIMIVFSLLLAMFPKKLRMNDEMRKFDHGRVELKQVVEKPKSGAASPLEIDRTPAAADENVGLKDFREAMKRILTNPLLVSNNLCAVFYILGVAGYFNFYNKYLEIQFHSSAAHASMFAGVTTVSSMVIGFVAAGVTITKLRPRTSYLLGWNILVGLTYMTGEMFLMFIGCDESGAGENSSNLGIINRQLGCNANCSCESVTYSPVCYENGNQTFFSSCHAGCIQVLTSRNKRMYGNCSCLPNEMEFVVPGPCNVDCFLKLVLFITIQCIIQLIGCSGRITTVLVNYRSIEARDKELAQGLSLFTVSLLAFIPGPIIYGKIIDSTCLVWDNKYGKRGNCWVYDKWQFRFNINLTSLCFTFGAVVLDTVVWYLGRNLELYHEVPQAEKSLKKSSRS